MGLFVDTVSADVTISELGITIPHPTSNYDIGGKFNARAIREATDLTTAITGGDLNWKKTSGGSIEDAADYDPDLALADEANLGTGLIDDRLVSFKDIDDFAETSLGIGAITCGYNGNAANGRFLEFHHGCPSDESPLVVPDNNLYLRRLSLSCTATTNCVVTIFKNMVAIDTVTLTAERSKTKKNINIMLDEDDGLAVQVTSGSARNPILQIWLGA